MSVPPTTTTRHAACPHDCPDTCAIEVRVQDGRIVHWAGRNDHPHTHGALCTKVSRYPERTLHPDRVLTPLKRVGAKGQGGFAPIGWDEALDTVASRLRDIAARNPEAIVPYSYAGTMGLVQGESMSARFFHRLGASRLARTICSTTGGVGYDKVYGAKQGMKVEQFANSRLILIWGSNSIASNLHFWTYAQRAKRAGAKLVCIDPRRTETADRCHKHLALMPGTDGALALGLMNALIEMGAEDRAFLENHTAGWPALRERALAWPVTRAAEVCGLDPQQITTLAQDMAQHHPVGIRLNYGMQRVHGGGTAVRLIAALPCVIGAWRDAAGGVLLSSSGHFPIHRDALERPDLLNGRQPRTLNMSTIGPDLLHPGSDTFGPRIEALIVYNSNPVAVAPHSPSVVAGFAREDVFTVVLEHFLTDTADHADIVLPATTQMEHDDIHRSYGHTDILLNQAALPPCGQALPNTEIFRRLAARMGYTEPCFQDTDAQLQRQAFGDDIDFALLERQGWVSLPVPDAPFAEGHFPTPDGRARLSTPGDVPDHVPNHECALSDPALAARFPLAMISPPARNFLNSSFVNVRSLRDIEGEPWLEIHPADAAARGIDDEAWVDTFNDRGRYRCRAKVSSRARPGVVHGLGIWWRKLGANGTNVNELTSTRLTDLGDGPTFYDCLVDVARVPSP